MSVRLSRRTLLRGLGTAISLPLLESMMPLTALAQSGGKQKAIRLAFFMVPNGMHMPAWTPTKVGSGFDLTPTLQPLSNVKDSISILTGLTQNNAFANGDGPGDHARSASVWLTGIHPKKTAGSDIQVGVSADQIAAAHMGTQTPYASLELGCEEGGVNGECDSGYSCAYSSHISWLTPDTPMAKEVNPRLVFNRLFGNEDIDETAQNRRIRDQERLSVLDFVSDDVRSLNNKLGTRDRGKLDEYLTGVREVELRVQRATNLNQAAVTSNVTAPAGIPANYGDHVKLMCDMLALAFQADLTRVSTFLWANEGSNRSFAEIGVPEGHHDLSHHGGLAEKQAKLAQINHYQMTMLAYFLEKLQSIDEGGSTLLDNSLVVFGGGISDGNRHNHDDLPVLLAGRGGGAVSSGRHIVYNDYTPLNNLYISMLDRAGVPTDHMGDSTGRLSYLL